MTVPLLLSRSLDLKFFLFGVPNVLVSGWKRRKLDLIGVEDFGLQVGKILGRLFRGAIQPVLPVKSLLKSDSLLGGKERFHRRHNPAAVLVEAAALSAHAGLGFDAFGVGVGRWWRWRGLRRLWGGRLSR